MMKPAVTMPEEMCKFCFSNGESLKQCRSHQLKDPAGLIICPVLRAFVCPKVC